MFEKALVRPYKNCQFVAVAFATLWTLYVNAEVIPIGQVQGRVYDGSDALMHRSPFEDKVVEIEGVIYQAVMMPTVGENVNHGLLIQNLPGSADGDPETSDGLFVYLGEEETIGRAGGERYRPRVGDIVRITGTVGERYGQTELVSPLVTEIIGHTHWSAGVLRVEEAGPPSDLKEAQRFWERREGMLHRLPKDSVAIAGRQMIPGEQEAYLWVVAGDSEIAQRDGVYARRVFRDAHPLDDVAEELFDNGNGHRVLLSSLGLKARSAQRDISLPALRTFDRITGPIVGGVSYGYGNYRMIVRDQFRYAPGPDPLMNASIEAKGSGSVRVATFNVENLYDYRDDPSDGCDFIGNDGCRGVRKPFDYVADSDAHYKERVREVSAFIVERLGTPDLVLIQEIEDQDFSPANGVQDVLEDVAREISERFSVAYASASNREGADARGINCAFLFRPDVIELVPVLYGEILEALGAVKENPAAVNPSGKMFAGPDSPVFARAMQVAVFCKIGSTASPLVVLNNHFKSRPDQQVAQRTRQAAANAGFVSRLIADSPNAQVIVGGDLNVYPRPDTALGNRRDDQLGPLYEAGLVNVYDRVLRENPAAAYSYVYEGQAQTLDHLFLSKNLSEKVTQARFIHANADWPDDVTIGGVRKISDHDPLVLDVVLVE